MSQDLRRTGIDLPEEVWRLIASYLPERRIYELLSVNRTFFNLALEARYRVVRWTKLDKKFLDVLHRLQYVLPVEFHFCSLVLKDFRSPVIAPRVRKLCIRAWFIDYLLKREAGLNKSYSQPLGGLVHFFSQLKLQREKKPVAGITDDYSSKRVMNAMISAIEGMSSVELHFEWRDLPITKDTKAFLDYTRAAFDRSLRKLTLQAPITKFKELLVITNFAYLQELNFHFDFSTSTFDHDSDEIQALSETILPFIDHRRTILRSLQLSSSSTVDLSKFFLALPVLPGLRQFGVDISFHKEQLSDPSGVVKFLTTHSHSLLSVQLKTNSSFTIFNKDQMLQKKADSWKRINDLLLAIPSCLSSLESLEIPYVSPQETIPLIRRSCDTLTKLFLTDHFLSVDEVTEVLDVFVHRPLELRCLHLEVDSLQATLIRLLACRLPDLHTLALVYKECPVDVPVSGE